jgi:hypothetical protein
MFAVGADGPCFAHKFRRCLDEEAFAVFLRRKGHVTSGRDVPSVAADLTEHG